MRINNGQILHTHEGMGFDTRNDQKTYSEISCMRVAGKAVAQALLTMSLAIQNGQRVNLPNCCTLGAENAD